MPSALTFACIQSHRLQTDPEIKSAIQWLIDHGASDRLVRHSQIVGGVARQLSRAIDKLAVQHDAALAVTGAALHDAGKIIHTEELDRPGDCHEVAGKDLLLREGMSPELAEMCVAHAAWSSNSTLEQLIVALADQLWRGRRPPDLESLLTAKVAKCLNIEPWMAYLQIEPILDAIAANAEARLAEARS